MTAALREYILMVFQFPDLKPHGPSGGMKQGGWLVREPELIPLIYEWIAHWLDSEDLPT